MAKNIMLQGTMSNVGKSFLTAALCRIFKQDGYSVAPFKSQNMALNSYITVNGEEIGRAQALQAEAAGVEPSALMNPILLKPTTDVGSQVIVNGMVLGNMKASEYFKRKKELIPSILSAYNELSNNHDIIVIEGAGSPVELNLKSDDIVNMGLAELIKSPVLLVGDIDRGGIFAQLIGTLNLLEPKELNNVKGLIVNKFRGDLSLFQDGIKILEDKANKPVYGVIPFINCNIEDEDSLSDKLNENNIDGIIDIAVIKLPKISNFTDFDVLKQYDGVSVRYISSPNQLAKPDLIIIPGTKSTISDMMWLNETGISDSVKQANHNGIPVFGICGGFQIMGKSISDPDNSECGGTINGLGLLNCTTIFRSEKRQIQVNGTFNKIDGFFSFLSGARFYGYEVHLGNTMCDSKELTTCGGCFAQLAAGCYIHGIFDSSDVSGRLINVLFHNKGLTYKGKIIDRKDYREEQINLLANNVRKSINMKKIYDILEEKK